MSKLILAVIFFILCISSITFSQNTSDNLISYKLKFNSSGGKVTEDSNKVDETKSKVQSTNIGGIFLSPSIGLAYPLGTFSSNSGNGLAYGAKLEFAFSKLYPFVIGFVYEGQSYKGDAGFMNNNLLTEFNTNITYLGGSLDIILNKFLKSDFTTPILSVEVKYAKVSRDVAPDYPLPGINFDQSLLTYSGSLAFTIYIFDLSTKYTYASEYSNLNFQLRFHFPVIKF